MKFRRDRFTEYNLHMLQMKAIRDIPRKFAKKNSLHKLLNKIVSKPTCYFLNVTQNKSIFLSTIERIVWSYFFCHSESVYEVSESKSEDSKFDHDIKCWLLTSYIQCIELCSRKWVNSKIIYRRFWYHFCFLLCEMFDLNCITSIIWLTSIVSRLFSGLIFITQLFINSDVFIENGNFSSTNSRDFNSKIITFLNNKKWNR